MIHRRNFLKTAGVAGAAILASGGLGQLLAATRKLTINIPGNSLGVHIPYMAAINEILPTLGDYGSADWERVPKLQTITQSILTGTTEVGAGDAISTLRAAEAGADLKIIGNAFMNTSLVFVVNGDKVKDYSDLEKSDITLAVNSKGDFTHVLLIGPLREKGVDLDKVNIITMGGSGSRMRALLAGRVDGVPIHFDQAAAVAEQGNYRVMVEPAKEFDAFLGEVWIVSSDWLSKPENEQAAVDLLKATITAFRKANSDPKWYAEMYRKYGTNDKMAGQSDEEIEVVRKALGEDIGCWPNDMRHSMSVYESLVPVYKAAGAIQGTVDLSKVVDTTVVEKALKDLG